MHSNVPPFGVVADSEVDGGGARHGGRGVWQEPEEGVGVAAEQAGTAVPVDVAPLSAALHALARRIGCAVT